MLFINRYKKKELQSFKNTFSHNFKKTVIEKYCRYIYILITNASHIPLKTKIMVPFQTIKCMSMITYHWDYIHKVNN